MLTSRVKQLSHDFRVGVLTIIVYMLLGSSKILSIEAAVMSIAGTTIIWILLLDWDNYKRYDLP